MKANSTIASVGHIVAPAVVTITLLLSVSEMSRAEECGCGDPASASARIEGTATAAFDVVFSDNGQEVKRTTITPPTSSAPITADLSVPLLEAGELKIQFTGGNGTAGIQFLSGGELLIRRSGESSPRAGDYIPSDGADWFVKRRYPFLRSGSGALGKLEDSLPRIVEPTYSGTSYPVPLKPSTLEWVLKLGEGGTIKVSGPLQSGSSVHNLSNLKFYPAPNTYSQDASAHNQYLSATSSGIGIYLVVREGSNTLKIYDANYLNLSSGPPWSTSGLTLLYTFSTADVSSSVPLDYGIEITKSSPGGSAVRISTLSGSVGGSTTSTHSEHDIGNGKKRFEDVLDENLAGGVLRETRLETEGTVGEVIRNTVVERGLVGGVEKVTKRTVETGTADAPLVSTYTWNATNNGVGFGALNKVVESHGGKNRGFRGYQYSYNAATKELTEHRFEPFLNLPASMPASPNYLMYSPGRVTTTVYAIATTARPRRLVRVTERINANITSDVAYSYDPSGDVVTVQQYDGLGGGAKLTTVTDNWPRDPAGTSNDGWAGKPKSITRPDGTKEVFAYTGVIGAATTTESSWGEQRSAGGAFSAVNNQSVKSTTTRDATGRRTREEQYFRISAAWQSASYTTFSYDFSNRSSSTFENGKIVRSLTYPDEGQITEQDLYGVTYQRVYDRLERMVSETRTSASSWG